MLNLLNKKKEKKNAKITEKAIAATAEYCVIIFKKKGKLQLTVKNVIKFAKTKIIGKNKL